MLRKFLSMFEKEDRLRQGSIYEGRENYDEKT